MKTWMATVQETYGSLEALEDYDEMYAIAARCGFDSPEELWHANPTIGGSTNPRDFGVAS